MNIYEQAVQYYGIKRQLIKLAEECSELAQACCKHHLYNDRFDNLIEEIVDVSIVSEQIISYYQAYDKRNDFMLQKISRLKNKIK